MNNIEKEQMIFKVAERIKLLSPETVYEKCFDYYQKIIKGRRR